MQVVIGIDIGTTNCKAVLVSTTGQVLHEERIVYPPAPTDTEQNADEICEAVITVLQKAGSVATRAGEICAVAFSAAMHSMLMVDAAGNALTHAITWADTRSLEQANHILSGPDAEMLYERTGVPAHPMSPLCKIMWWKDNEPGKFSQAHKFVSIKEYIWHKIFGEYVIDQSIASATGLFDIHKLQWCEAALEKAGIDAHQLSLPVPVLHKKYRSTATPSTLPAIGNDVPFFIGSSDGCMANLGTGIIDTTKAALTIGTSGAVRTTVAQPLVDKYRRLFSYRVTDNFYVTGGPVNNGGIILKWFAEQFLNRSFTKETDFAWLDPMLSSIQQGADKLIFLPYLLGERAPIWNAQAKGIFFGLTTAHTKAHMLRALVEAICFSLCDVLNAVEDVNGPVQTIYASGGFIHSKAWLQILSNVLGKEIILTNKTDASAVGAAFLALHGTGALTSLQEVQQFVNPETNILPDAGNHAMYKEYFSLYTALYRNVEPLFSKLYALP